MSYRKGAKKPYRNKQMVLPSLTAKAKVKSAVARAKAKQPVMAPPTPPTAPSSSFNDVDVLHKNSEGYYARFKSKSNPSAKPYVTRIWTTASGRFQPGDVSCNCNGWVYNHKCHHTDDIQDLYREAQANGTLTRLPA